MTYNVILSKNNGAYTARVKEWPEVTVQEPTRDKALDQIKSLLTTYLTKDIEMVQIDLPVASSFNNPWIEKFGYFAEDPTFDDLQEKIALYREKIEQDHDKRYE